MGTAWFGAITRQCIVCFPEGICLLSAQTLLSAERPIVVVVNANTSNSPSVENVLLEAFHMEISFIHTQILVHLHVNKTNLQYNTILYLTWKYA